MPPLGVRQRLGWGRRAGRRVTGPGGVPRRARVAPGPVPTPQASGSLSVHCSADQLAHTFLGGLSRKQLQAHSRCSLRASIHPSWAKNLPGDRDPPDRSLKGETAGRLCAGGLACRGGRGWCLPGPQAEQREDRVTHPVVHSRGSKRHLPPTPAPTGLNSEAQKPGVCGEKGTRVPEAGGGGLHADSARLRDSPSGKGAESSGERGSL